MALFSVLLWFWFLLFLFVWFFSQALFLGRSTNLWSKWRLFRKCDSTNVKNTLWGFSRTPEELGSCQGKFIPRWTYLAVWTNLNGCLHKQNFCFIRNFAFLKLVKPDSKKKTKKPVKPVTKLMMSFSRLLERLDMSLEDILILFRNCHLMENILRGNLFSMKKFY